MKELNYFISPIHGMVYVIQDNELGLYDEWMLFKIGEEVNLFENLIYANAFYKVDDNRIMTVYQAGTARDYVYKEVKGVWQWK